MKKITIIFIFLVILGVGGFLMFKKNPGELSIQNDDNEKTEVPEGQMTGQILGPYAGTKDIKEYLNTGSWKKYDGSMFSFKYSGNFKVSSQQVEGGELLSAEDENFGFQVFISAFDEKGPVTPERIWKDLPDEVINEPKVADLDGVETLVFYGLDDEIGETFEAWTARNGKLYQIMTTKVAEQLLIEVLNTWGWK
jgi:hypothetical protein